MGVAGVEVGLEEVALPALLPRGVPITLDKPVEAGRGVPPPWGVPI